MRADLDRLRDAARWPTAVRRALCALGSVLHGGSRVWALAAVLLVTVELDAVMPFDAGSHWSLLAPGVLCLAWCARRPRRRTPARALGLALAIYLTWRPWPPSIEDAWAAWAGCALAMEWAARGLLELGGQPRHPGRRRRRDTTGDVP
ncbi:MAG TPA: hypothetical protein VI300_00010 [Solirubrobacter sp.]